MGGLRKRWPGMHRWLGRLYLGIGVGCGGLAGLFMSTQAYGGLVSHLGFGALALFWLGTGFRALSTIRAGKVAEHRRWMIRNFSLTLAAVTLRIYLPASMLADMEFELAYPAISWLCWVPNLLIAEWLFVRAGKPRH